MIVIVQRSLTNKKVMIVMAPEKTVGSISGFPTVVLP